MTEDLDPQTLVLGDLPAVPFFERNKLPHSSGIYFVINATSEVLYIGRATSFLGRWRNHHRLMDFRAIDGIRIAWLTVSDPELCPEIEKAMIAHFRPSLNSSSVIPFVSLYDNRGRPRHGTERKILITLKIAPSRAAWLKTVAQSKGRSRASLIEEWIDTFPIENTSEILTE